MISYKRVTLAPVGADGSAAASAVVAAGKHGLVRALKVDYQNQPATVDIVVTDGHGSTVFTRTSSATDIAWSPAATVGVDEAGGASSGTDVVGLPFVGGLHIAVAQGDGQTSGDEKIVMEFLLEL